MNNNRSLLIGLGIVVVTLLIVLSLVLMKNRKRNQVDTTISDSSQQETSNSKSTGTSVAWSYDGDSWKPQGTPPTCDDPIIKNPPADLSAATHLLSPGQERTGGYKPHGAIRFEGKKNSEVSVVVPQDASVVRASRYIEEGETQHMFDLQTTCGIRFRYDHLLTLSPEFQALADKLPPPQKDDSRTTDFTPPVAVKQGDVIATAVGFEKLNGTGNTFFDFGVYDLRQKNQATQDAAWVSKRQGELELAGYAVCWFDKFSATNNALVKQILTKDTESDRKSDYCK